MSKKLKFIFIIFLSLAISASAAYSMTELPSLAIYPMEYDYSIPIELVEKLRSVQTLPFVSLGQHGYEHKYNETFEQVLMGYKIMKNNSLDVDYYIPPYIQYPPPYEVPATLFYIPERTDGIYYAKEGMDYGESSVDGAMTLSIHIQDDITTDWLNEISKDKDFTYLRVDDVNTDIVDVDTQVSRIYTSVSFCSQRGCTLVLGIIPHVPRLFETDKAYLFFNKTMIILGIMLLLPIYLFYFLSYYLSWWLK
jgi:hypothetical protein